MLESSTGFWEGSADVESVLKVNEPKGSELSKLFSGTAANGSTIGLVGTEFIGLVSG